MLAVDETIVAIATPPRGGIRGIVRLSGPKVLECLRAEFVADDGSDWTHGTVSRVLPGRLRIDDWGRSMECLLYWWPTRRSYTRQPTAELHVLGSPPLLQRIVENACQRGARLAAPGEFTLRAFLAGRLDLPQAEAVLGVIDARSDRQLDIALTQLAGGLSEQMHRLRDDLLNLLADLEAGLDFVEEDIAFVTAEQTRDRLEQAIVRVEQSLVQMQSRATPADEPSVVLIGRPNAGKSRLFNLLAGEALAIESDEKGTTRDFVACHTTLAGIPCQLVDTAGIEAWEDVARPAAAPLLERGRPGSSQPGRPVDREDASSPEVMAQEVTGTSEERATIVLVCVDLSVPVTPAARQRVAQRDAMREIVVGTKSDLPGDPRGLAKDDCDVCVSALHNPEAARADLVESVGRRLATDQQLAGETVVSTALRCRHGLQACRDGLRRALYLCQTQAGDELVVAELRLGLDAIGQVVGAVYTDDLLDRVFSRFCIGK